MTGSLDASQLDAFSRDGYLVVESVLGEADLAPLWAEYEARLEQVAERLFAAGRVSGTYADLPFGDRYGALVAEDPDVFNHLEISYPLEREVLGPDTPIHSGPAVFSLLRNERLLDVVESVIGPEILVSPVHHARIKPPLARVPASLAANSYIGKTTWHQDQGALLDEANATRILTVWVAITDCPKERGCLVVMPGSHRKNGGALTPHCPGEGIASENWIPPALLGDGAGNRTGINLPVAAGSVVLFNQFTEHCALPNRSDSVRMSFDLRYNAVGEPTGRPAFPGFVARSRSNPASELHDPDEWAASWREAKARILDGRYDGPLFNAARWAHNAGADICA